MNEPHWQRLWRCPYCQNIITDEVMLPLPVESHRPEESPEGEGDIFACPVCKNISYVPED